MVHKRLPEDGHDVAGKHDLVGQLLAAKEASGKTFTQISKEIGLTNAFTAQLFYNQVKPWLQHRGVPAELLLELIKLTRLCTAHQCGWPTWYIRFAATLLVDNSSLHLQTAGSLVRNDVLIGAVMWV